MSANTHDDTPQPTRSGFMERKGKLEEMDRSFDLKFWQAQDDTALQPLLTLVTRRVIILV